MSNKSKREVTRTRGKRRGVEKRPRQQDNPGIDEFERARKVLRDARTKLPHLGTKMIEHLDLADALIENMIRTAKGLPQKFIRLPNTLR